MESADTDPFRYAMDEPEATWPLFSTGVDYNQQIIFGEHFSFRITNSSEESLLL